MSYTKIIAEIKSKKAKPVYFLHGEEPYFIDQITNAAENVLAEHEKAFNQTILYGKDVPDFKMVVDVARRFPMGSEKQVVIIKEAQAMKSLKDLETYVKNPMPSTLLVIAHKYKKLDARTKFAKTLKANAEVFESKKLYDDKIPAWVSNYLMDKGYRLKPTAGALIGEYLGSDISKITNELDKLTINLPRGIEINEDHVQDNIGISKDYNVFELQNALGKRDVVKCNRIVNYFISNPKSNPLVMVLGSLYNYFNKVYITKSMSTASDDAIAKAIGLRSSWFLKDYKLAAKKYSISHLKQIFGVLKAYDLRSKGLNNRNVNHEGLLKEMIFQILHEQVKA
jgi:DNA polymerase-3 subunit delta